MQLRRLPRRTHFGSKGKTFEVELKNKQHNAWEDAHRKKLESLQRLHLEIEQHEEQGSRRKDGIMALEQLRKSGSNDMLGCNDTDWDFLQQLPEEIRQRHGQQIEQYLKLQKELHDAVEAVQPSEGVQLHELGSESGLPEGTSGARTS